MTGYYYSGIWRSIYRLPCLIIGTVKLVDITEQSLGIPLQYGIVCSRVSKGQDVPLSLCPGIKSFLVQLSLCPRTRAAAKNSVTNSSVPGQNHYLIDKKNFIKNCSFFTLFSLLSRGYSMPGTGKAVKIPSQPILWQDFELVQLSHSY